VKFCLFALIFFCGTLWWFCAFFSKQQGGFKNTTQFFCRQVGSDNGQLKKKKKRFSKANELLLFGSVAFWWANKRGPG
jgi:hypothetical protein